jgi:putative ABC transport system permease protein
MLKNYIKIAFRNLQRNTIYSFINIAGLAVGIACSILILLWVHDEVMFDRFLPKHDRLFQVLINSDFNGKINTWNSVPLPTYEALKTEDSRIKNTAVSDWGAEHLLVVDDKRIVKNGYHVSKEFLDMFQFKVLQGDPLKALDELHAIVITESTAKALFGDEDPINKIIRTDNRNDLKVTAVVADVPSNSTFQFDLLLSYKLYESQDWVKEASTYWGNYSFQVYVELNEAEDELEVEATIKDLLTRKGQTDIKREFLLHPLNRWHLYSTFEGGKENGGMIDYVKLFSAIAIFILLIACINFMNLATARSERRAREVGIRKSVGSGRKELIFQFLGESLVIAFIAFLFAVVIVEVSLPFYNHLTQKKLVLDYTSSLFWIFSSSLILITGIVSGSYPAFYLSSFRPVKVLKGKIQIGKSVSLPRKVLVTLQFGFSILLIVGTIVIYQQIQHVKTRQLGYAQQNLISIDYTVEIGQNYGAIKQELLQAGLAKSVTQSNSPIDRIYSNNFLDWPGKPDDQKVIFTTIATEYDYTQTMGIKVLEGRDFSRDFPSDSSAIIINKAALDIMQLENPIGEQLSLWGGKRTLVGVVDNVLMGSVYREIAPMFIVFMPDWVSTITVRLNTTNDLQASLKKIENIFSKYNSAYPFEYSFVDTDFQKKFTDITMISQLTNLFTFLAILITSLGLFGLAAFTAEQRTKEIGIRKVLGATVANLVLLISKDFSRLVLIAFVFAGPVSWWALNNFLERYPYRISIPWWVLPMAGITALLFALAIVSTQALKAATNNPTESLRNE